jgi:UDP-N-acetylmuramate--alanine ligase
MSNQIQNLGLSAYKKAYFLGIGGIGMSAICRYFLSVGMEVAGYDKTPTSLTDELIKEGAGITFEDSIESLPEFVKALDKDVLYIFTPAIPADHNQKNWLVSQGIELKKRAEVLGIITRDAYCIAVAGTHGKTTTSSLVAHILHANGINFTAFLGGISSNYNTNYIHYTTGENLMEKPLVVVEADEFDRSFHQLSPNAAIITAADPDHLDIYGTAEAFFEAFEQFANSCVGNVYIHSDVDLQPQSEKTKTFRYGYLNSNQEKNSENSLDFYFDQVRIKQHKFEFDFSGTFEGVKCGLPGFHNISNATAAFALCQESLKISPEKIATGISSFKGVKRRFEYIIDTDQIAYIDDYAHHPQELNAIITSVKALYPDYPITGIFQPHLFTRTRDFMPGFAHELSQLDEVWLMDIYPAREQPIEGITSKALLDKIPNTNKRLLGATEILNTIKIQPPRVLLTLGAGDIDKLVPQIKALFTN